MVLWIRVLLFSIFKLQYSASLLCDLFCKHLFTVVKTIMWELLLLHLINWKQATILSCVKGSQDYAVKYVPKGHTNSR